MTTLANMLRERRQPTFERSKDLLLPHTFPAKTIVVDSAPGSDALSGLLRAFTTGIRSRIIRYAAYAALTAVWSASKIFSFVFPRKLLVIDKLRDDLVNPDVLPRDAKRLYIYSKTDQLIRYQDVESNISAARRQGVDVKTEEYRDSPHVAHARTDGKR